MKFLFSLITGIAIGTIATLYTVKWQEEDLYFEISETARFGQVTYQNLKLVNEGWNPATNVIIEVQGNQVAPTNVHAAPSFDVPPEGSRIGGYARIRRGETVTVAFAFEGPEILPTAVAIKSDRSIAVPRLPDSNVDKVEWWKLLLGGALGWLLLGMIAAIVIPAYRDYVKRAKQRAEGQSAA